ncbi:hypothetical protein EJB05_09053, partial [Eragrostis curvula]
MTPWLMRLTDASHQVFRMAPWYEEDDDMTCFFAPATKKMQAHDSCLSPVVLDEPICDITRVADVNADLDVLIALSCWCGKLKILENTLKIMTSGSGQYKYVYE